MKWALDTDAPPRPLLMLLWLWTGFWQMVLRVVER
jgi:hypothetical protein